MNRIKFPNKVMIQTTSLCNSNCVMCPYGKTMKIQPQGKMEWKLFKKIINECKKHDVKRILLYLMNEPLMDKDIVKKINYAKKRNPKAIVHLVSNGNLLNEKLSKKLLNQNSIILNSAFMVLKKILMNKSCEDLSLIKQQMK